MLKSMSIAFKMIGGFVIIAIITAAVGVVGWQGITSATSDINLLGNQSIPALLDLEILKISMLEIKVSMRTLMSADVSVEDFDRQYANIEKARSNYNASVENYTNLNLSAEERKMYEKINR